MATHGYTRTHPHTIVHIIAFSIITKLVSWHLPCRQTPPPRLAGGHSTPQSEADDRSLNEFLLTAVSWAYKWALSSASYNYCQLCCPASRRIQIDQDLSLFRIGNRQIDSQASEPSIRLSGCLYLSVYQYFCIYPSVFLGVCVFIYLSDYLFVYRCIGLFVYMFVPI